MPASEANGRCVGVARPLARRRATIDIACARISVCRPRRSIRDRNFSRDLSCRNVATAWHTTWRLRGRYPGLGVDASPVWDHRSIVRGARSGLEPGTTVPRTRTRALEEPASALDCRAGHRDSTTKFGSFERCGPAPRNPHKRVGFDVRPGHARRRGRSNRARPAVRAIQPRLRGLLRGAQHPNGFRIRPARGETRWDVLRRRVHAGDAVP